MDGHQGGRAGGAPSAVHSTNAARLTVPLQSGDEVVAPRAVRTAAGPHQHVSVRERRWTGALYRTRQLRTRGGETSAPRCHTQKHSAVSLGTTRTLPIL